MELWEVLPSDMENADPLEKLPEWKKMRVVLYLESFANEADLCTTMDCDNQGVEQVGRLRVLLVSAKDAAFIAEQDSMYATYNVDSKLAGMPEKLPWIPLSILLAVWNPSGSQLRPMKDLRSFVAGYSSTVKTPKPEIWYVMLSAVCIRKMPPTFQWKRERWSTGIA